MLSSKIGPFDHPEGKHPHRYWVYKLLEMDDRWLVCKTDPYNYTEYVVNTKRGLRNGEVCNCPHHTHRKVPCLHMGFVKDAQEVYKMWQEIGWA